MALAPRKQGGQNRQRSKAADKDFKKEQRARNGTRSGSSGAGKKVSGLPKVEWSEIEETVDHVTDITGKISHSQVGASGLMSVTLQIPLEYAHNALSAHLASRDALVYIRVYGVSFEKFLKAAGVDLDADGEFDPLAVV